MIVLVNVNGGASTSPSSQQMSCGVTQAIYFGGNMKRASSSPERSACSNGYPPTIPPTQESGTVVEDEPTGWHHLLENHTLSQIKELINFPFSSFEISRAFDRGALPDAEASAARFVLAMLTLDEPKVKAAILGLKEISMPVHTAEQALLMLDAVFYNPELSFSNISLHLLFHRRDQVDAILATFKKLMSADSGINRITVRLDASEDAGNGLLFADLARIDGLRLTIEGGGFMARKDVSHLLDLVSTNNRIHLLRLDALPDSEASGATSENHVRLFRALKAQTRLEEFFCPGIKEDCHEMLGDFVGSSQSIKSLSIGLLPRAPGLGLIRGLERNTSLETLVLDMYPTAQGASPSAASIQTLIYAFKKSKCAVAHLQLHMFRCPPDAISALFNAREEARPEPNAIASLLANNSRLSTLRLQLPNDVCLDLLPIGEGLAKNHSLERLHIGFGNPSSNQHGGAGSLNVSSFPSFFNRLARNRTLVGLTIQNAGSHERLFQVNENLLSILDRNASFQKYACSRAYIAGAAASFFESLDLPSELASVLAPHLEAQRPRTGTRSLALINKAGSQRACETRRQESAVDLKAALGVLQGGGYFAFKPMQELFRNIAAAGQDFSDLDLQRIADSNVFGPTLVEWMDKDSADYMYLAKRFRDALGTDRLREKFTFAFTHPSDMTPHRLAMLEQTFPPDQKHLVSLIGRELDYRSIEPLELKFFVGYNVVQQDDFRLHLLMDEVIHWCFQHDAPELYLAYIENFPGVLVETQTMPTRFLERFLSLLPVRQKIKRLLLMNIGYEDHPHLIEPLLSNGSGLQYLSLHNFNCTSRSFHVVMDKLSENTQLRRFGLYLPASQQPFRLMQGIRHALRKNHALRVLDLKVPSRHFELPLLEHLSVTDTRFRVKTRYSAYLSDSSEDGSDSSEEGSTESQHA